MDLLEGDVMGNHEFPCEVCGENKFGLMGCKEYRHTAEEIRAAIKRMEKNGLPHFHLEAALKYRES